MTRWSPGHGRRKRTCGYTVCVHVRRRHSSTATQNIAREMYALKKHCHIQLQIHRPDAEREAQSNQTAPAANRAPCSACCLVETRSGTSPSCVYVCDGTRVSSTRVCMNMHVCLCMRHLNMALLVRESTHNICMHVRTMVRMYVRGCCGCCYYCCCCCFASFRFAADDDLHSTYSYSKGCTVVRLWRLVPAQQCYLFLQNE